MAQNNLAFPHDIQELDDEEKSKLLKVYKTSNVDQRFDFVSVGPKKYKQLRPYCEEAANIYNMPLRSSDVFVVTYQRSGTTWTQELVWLLANDFDYDRAKAELLNWRFPHLELVTLFNKKWQEELLHNSINKINASSFTENLSKYMPNKLTSLPSPRLIKSHLPLSLLPPTLLDTAKVIYVARDPRDVAVSTYHLYRLLKIMHFPENFKEFWNLFLHDLVNRTPYFEHVKEAWALKNHPKMLFLFYEDMKKDLPAAVRRVANFLGKEVKPEQMSRLCDHLSFENFKKNPSVNIENLKGLDVLDANETFVRQGKAGGWRDYFDEEMTQQAEQWIADNLRDTDLRFPHM